MTTKLHRYVKIIVSYILECKHDAYVCSYGALPGASRHSDCCLPTQLELRAVHVYRKPARKRHTWCLFFHLILVLRYLT
jgi:hypothetical protein